ncbi:uncharacterized protein N7483_002329 [Penicillium malachiteum]|uniref:uncharacterized protein n=1 Tax=Penicillium malachiteum TaxID=1324776 RepID=UPI0025482933|nr:uncharacterized protein N7483_002329 [Penicillium malachiteum]KAJ5737204.1 hypothetical protein N7483_002329 [Penicillium malachiteum]
MAKTRPPGFVKRKEKRKAEKLEELQKGANANQIIGNGEETTGKNVETVTKSQENEAENTTKIATEKALKNTKVNQKPGKKADKKASKNAKTSRWLAEPSSRGLLVDSEDLMIETGLGVEADALGSALDASKKATARLERALKEELSRKGKEAETSLEDFDMDN